jgi:antitoxin component YwqK of YwqJK toxin-antitoxin module
MMRNIIVRSLVFTLLTILSVSDAKKPVTHVSLQVAENSIGFKVGDSEESVTRCLGNPRGTITLPENKKRLLFYGGGNIELNHGKVSSITLPNEDWPRNIWGALNRDQITSDRSSTYKWDLLADNNSVAQGIWEFRDAKDIKRKHGDPRFSYPSDPTPFAPCFMKYSEGILTLSSSEGIKCAQLTFRDGNAQGPCCFWHSDGSVWMKGQYDDNIKKGDWARWELNGDLSLINYPERNQSIQASGFTQSCVWPAEYIRQGMPQPIVIGDEIKWTLKRSDCANELSGIWKKGERIPFAEEIFDSAESTLMIFTIDDKQLIQFAIKKGEIDGTCRWWNLDGSKRIEGWYKDNVPVRFQYYKGNHQTTIEFDENGRAHIQ